MQSGTDQASLRGQVLSAPVISPIDSGWSLLVNLGPAIDPATLLDPIDDWVTSAFTFGPADGTFHAYRAGLAVINDLGTIESGQAFWAFSRPDRLQGNVTFWQQRLAPAISRWHCCRASISCPGPDPMERA